LESQTGFHEQYLKNPAIISKIQQCGRMLKMRLDSGLSDLLAGRQHLAILRVLWQLPAGLERSGRDLARRAGVDDSTANRVLTDLARHAAVKVRSVPPANYFALNREHVLVGAILAALQVEQDIQGQLLAFVHDQLWGTGAVDVRLFGSAARGEMRSDSDVDLALIAPAGQKEQVFEAASMLYEQIWNRFGVRPNFLVGEVSVDEMAQTEETSEGVWHRVEAEGIGVTG
jgi:predicted nucleotidyltransferase